MHSRWQGAPGRCYVDRSKAGSLSQRGVLQKACQSRIGYWPQTTHQERRGQLLPGRMPRDRPDHAHCPAERLSPSRERLCTAARAGKPSRLHNPGRADGRAGLSARQRRSAASRGDERHRQDGKTEACHPCTAQRLALGRHGCQGDGDCGKQGCDDGRDGEHPGWAARKKHVSAVPASAPLITHDRQQGLSIRHLSPRVRPPGRGFGGRPSMERGSAGGSASSHSSRGSLRSSPWGMSWASVAFLVPRDSR
jgi:hypothetical protein